MTLRQIGQLVLMSALWGAVFMLIKYALVDFSPVEVAFFQADTSAVWSSYWYRGRIYVNSGSGAWVLEVPGLKG